MFVQEETFFDVYWKGSAGKRDTVRRGSDQSMKKVHAGASRSSIAILPVHLGLFLILPISSVYNMFPSRMEASQTVQRSG